jgi:hypothetical protein
VITNYDPVEGVSVRLPIAAGVVVVLLAVVLADCILAAGST